MVPVAKVWVPAMLLARPGGAAAPIVEVWVAAVLIVLLLGLEIFSSP